ncbi:MAG: hypothetical protein IJQ07_00950 [Clostridia bacterium]|nr:hypothetical protein [Clostridia bacterium]
MLINNKIEARKNDAILEFQYILTTYIKPLLQCEGKLIFKDKKTINHKLKKYISCYKNGQSFYLYFFPSLETPQFHYRILTKNPKQKLGIAEKILREIMLVSNFDYRNSDFSLLNFYDTKQYVYRNARFDVAYELGLCNWLGSNCLYELIQRLYDWAQKTYEGNHMSFSFLIDSSNKLIGTTNYVKFLKNDHSAVFTDAISSGIKLDSNGNIIEYFSTAHKHSDDKHTAWAPYEFIDFASLCDSGWIGVIMQNNGDILIFKKRSLVFAKRNGKWAYLNSFTIQTTVEKFYERQSDDSSKKFADEVHSSVLDTSFAHTGGCIAIIKKEYCNDVLKTHFLKDALTAVDPKNEKKAIVQRLINAGSLNEAEPYFQHLDRKLRLELLSLDGATVLDSSGKILCVGAIVRIDGGSDGGGRLAATKELAKYGLAIKISEDGGIQGFSSTTPSDDAQTLFKTFLNKEEDNA